MAKTRVWSVMAVALTGALVLGASMAPAIGQVRTQPSQPVKVTNTTAELIPVMGKTDVILDEFRDLDDPVKEGCGVSENELKFINCFGTYDLSPYEEITIYLVGDCVFESPYDCAEPGHLTDTVDLELRTTMGHPDSAHTDTDWSIRRPFHWMTGAEKGWIEVETLKQQFPDDVQFRVHYFSGPVHLRVLGRR